MFKNIDNYGWHQLCSEQRDSPYFTINSHSVAGFEQLSVSHEPNTVASEEVTTAVMSHADDASYERTGVHCRDQLSTLLSKTYLNTNGAVLTELLSRLQTINAWFVGTLSSEDGLLLDVENRPHLSRRASTLPAPQLSSCSVKSTLSLSKLKRKRLRMHSVDSSKRKRRHHVHSTSLDNYSMVLLVMYGLHILY